MKAALCCFAMLVGAATVVSEPNKHSGVEGVVTGDLVTPLSGATVGADSAMKDFIEKRNPMPQATT
jgi:hypothetical protein